VLCIIEVAMDTRKSLELSRDKDSIIKLLKGMVMFDELAGDEFLVAASYMNLYELKKGEFLFKEGDTGDYVCFVASGGIDVLKESITGKRVVISTVKQGYSLGEMSVIDETYRSASAMARENSSLVVLARNGFRIILDNHPEIGIKMLKGIARLLSRNMRKTSERLADYMLPL